VVPVLGQAFKLFCLRIALPGKTFRVESAGVFQKVMSVCFSDMPSILQGYYEYKACSHPPLLPPPPPAENC
jgi:hypothetical protein